MTESKDEIIMKLKNLAMKRCAERIERAHNPSDDLVMNVRFVPRNNDITIFLRRNHGLE